MIFACRRCGSRLLLPTLVWEAIDEPYIGRLECLSCGFIAEEKPRKRHVSKEVEEDNPDKIDAKNSENSSRKEEKRLQRLRYADKSRART